MWKCLRSSEPFSWKNENVSVPVTLEVGKNKWWRKKTYCIDHGHTNYGVTDNLEKRAKTVAAYTDNLTDNLVEGE